MDGRIERRRGMGGKETSKCDGLKGEIRVY